MVPGDRRSFLGRLIGKSRTAGGPGRPENRRRVAPSLDALEGRVVLSSGFYGGFDTAMPAYNGYSTSSFFDTSGISGLDPNFFNNLGSNFGTSYTPATSWTTDGTIPHAYLTGSFVSSPFDAYGSTGLPTGYASAWNNTLYTPYGNVAVTTDGSIPDAYRQGTYEINPGYGNAWGGDPYSSYSSSSSSSSWGYTPISSYSYDDNAPKSTASGTYAVPGWDMVGGQSVNPAGTYAVPGWDMIGGQSVNPAGSYAVPGWDMIGGQSVDPAGSYTVPGWDNIGGQSVDPAGSYTVPGWDNIGGQSVDPSTTYDMNSYGY